MIARPLFDRIASAGVLPIAPTDAVVDAQSLPVPVSEPAWPRVEVGVTTEIVTGVARPDASADVGSEALPITRQVDAVDAPAATPMMGGDPPRAVIDRWALRPAVDRIPEARAETDPPMTPPPLTLMPVRRTLPALTDASPSLNPRQQPSIPAAPEQPTRFLRESADTVRVARPGRLGFLSARVGTMESATTPAQTGALPSGEPGSPSAPVVPQAPLAKQTGDTPALSAGRLALIVFAIAALVGIVVFLARPGGKTP